MSWCLWSTWRKNTNLYSKLLFCILWRRFFENRNWGMQSWLRICVVNEENSIFFAVNHNCMVLTISFFFVSGSDTDDFRVFDDTQCDESDRTVTLFYSEFWSTFNKSVSNFGNINYTMESFFNNFLVLAKISSLYLTMSKFLFVWHFATQFSRFHSFSFRGKKKSGNVRKSFQYFLIYSRKGSQ